MKLVEQYVAGVRRRFAAEGMEEELEDFAKVEGASEEDMKLLLDTYPLCPEPLLALLEQVDGTYWRTYGDSEIAVPILGSDIDEYPYYLLSAKQMAESSERKDTIIDIYGEYFSELKLDSRIDPNLPMGRRLHFSDCVNNGGTSKLYIDFDPAPTGKSGQIVRYIHDPDGYKVIADSFEEYLKNLMEWGYDFINAD